MNRAHVLLTLLTLLLVSGCTAVYSINTQTHPVERFRLNDQRPLDEREGALSYFGKEIPISSYGDDSFVPDRLAILKSRLDETLRASLTGKAVDVVHFRTLQYNAPTTGLAQIIFGQPRPLPAIPDPRKSWFIVDIELRVDGHTVQGHSAEEIPTCLGCMKDAMPKAVLTAIESVVKEAASKFQQ